MKFFSITHPELLTLRRSDRNKAIQDLEKSDPHAFSAWIERRREDLNLTKFLKGSGRFPLSTTKNVNSYAVFQELALQVTSRHGHSGMVLQSGIATDDINKELFRYMVETNRLKSLLDFENRNSLFPDVDSRMRFCLLSCHGPVEMSAKSQIFAFGLGFVEDLRQNGRTFELSSQQFHVIAPNTGLCPTFRSQQDADLVLKLYDTTGVFVHESKADGNPWGATIRRLFSMAYDSGDFVAGVKPPDPAAKFLRVFEAKLFHQFDHRYATYRTDGTDNCTCYVLTASEGVPEILSAPQLWALRTEVRRRLDSSGWSRQYLLGFRDITNATNERTCIACILPDSAPDDTIRLVFTAGSGRDHAALISNLNAFVLDYAARNCVASTHLSEYIAKQLPIASPSTYSEACRWADPEQNLRDWLLPRVLELTYTAWDLVGFARDCDSSGPPFQWDDDRRFLLRCELDAAFFHLYMSAGKSCTWRSMERESVESLVRLKANFPTPRDAMVYIMDSFPIVRRRDEGQFKGDFRTKRVILEIYDAMQEAIRTDQPYQTRLDPPPADPRRRHPKPKVGILAFGSLINDPGSELKPRIIFRIKTQTPFPVEYGRYSGKTRGGAPTLVPHQTGARISAEIFVLDNDVTVEEARDMLWRRERRKIDTIEKYREADGPNSVLIRVLDNDSCVSTILFTDFLDAGKILNPTAEELAEHAIRSVATVGDERDGITYLIDAIEYGIETPLTRAYRDEILRQTNSATLEEALRILKGQ